MDYNNAKNNGSNIENHENFNENHKNHENKYIIEDNNHISKLYRSFNPHNLFNKITAV